MTAYATIEDLEKEVGSDELLQIAGTGETRSTLVVDTDKVTAALTDATDFVNSYVGMRYELPLPAEATGALRLLKRFTVDVARYYLRNKNEGGGDVADFVVDRYKDAQKQLMNYRDGHATLAVAIEKNKRPSGSVHAAPVSPVFGNGGAGLDYYGRGGFR